MFLNLKHKLIFSFLTAYSLSFLFSLCARDLRASDLDELHSMVDGLLDQNFRVRENTKLTLDGSEEASSIQRVSRFTNEFVFAGEKGWRVRRQLPISEVTREYRKTINTKDEHIQLMTPSNRGVELREPTTDAVWMEALATPLRLAQQWSLAQGATKLSHWLADLRSLKAPMKNAEGDEISVEVPSDPADKTIKINFKGSILHDGKTRMKIESTWTLMDVGKITDADLSRSLIRSS